MKYGNRAFGFFKRFNNVKKNIDRTGLALIIARRIIEKNTRGKLAEKYT
jgi:hypothetical protein